MGDETAESVVLFGGSWDHVHDERSFVARTVAAAVSRQHQVVVLVPGPPGPSRPDGAFDLVPVGGRNGAGVAGWPTPGDARWPDPPPSALVVVDDADLGALALADHFLPGVPTAPIVSWTWTGTEPTGGEPRDAALLAVGVGDDPPAVHQIGLHAPVHALAAAQRHVGLGFVDYLLVLGDRGPEAADDESPTPLVRWLAARFADRHLVVVENATASVWRSRSLRGTVSVATRVDLWRLVAHARLTVDLAPGPLIARECVESLRYGVPVVVPGGGAAARLAARGGGLWFGDEAELLGCVEALDDPVLRDTLGQQGQAVADAWYGDPHRFVDRVGRALDAYLTRPRAR
jgi:hypothetical protein